jgi:aryl-alcohol dehydrogenase-like predicted oxidoreductase
MEKLKNEGVIRSIGVCNFHTHHIDEILKVAANHSYEAALMVMMVITLAGLMGFIMRWLVKNMDSRASEAKDRE